MENQDDREIQEIYEEIYALDTVEKQEAALISWWKYLEDTCSNENLCIECKRERRRAQSEEGG